MRYRLIWHRHWPSNTTRMKDSSNFMELPLDDNRHIVVYLPGKAKQAPTMVPSS